MKLISRDPDGLSVQVFGRLHKVFGIPATVLLGKTTLKNIPFTKVAPSLSPL